MLEPSPSTSGRDNTHRIESLARAVATIEREMSGMRKEYIDSTDGKRYEVLARYFGLSDAVSALELPFEIYVGSEVPSGGSVAQTFIGARDGSLDMEPITDVKEFSPSSGECGYRQRLRSTPPRVRQCRARLSSSQHWARQHLRSHT